eukprot:2661742-Alexandrium_andersonii.AAC.1
MSARCSKQRCGKQLRNATKLHQTRRGRPVAKRDPGCFLQGTTHSGRSMQYARQGALGETYYPR